MKKTILFFGLVAGIFTANAQKTDNTTLNVRLYPIQDITVNSAQKTVNLDYKTTTDYNNGVNIDQKDHLTVYSTGAFAVTVQSSGATLTNISGDTINAADISITASAGSASLTGATYESATLSTTAAPLFSATTGGVNKTVNINYAAKGDLNKYVNKYYNTQNPTVYTTEVIYTIAAQ